MIHFNFEMDSVTFQVRMQGEDFLRLKREVQVRNKDSMARGHGRITVSGFSAYAIRSVLAKIDRLEELDEQSEGAL